MVVRRALILGLVACLVGIGPVPLSACALLSSSMAECTTPQTQSQCDRMSMMDLDESGNNLVAAPDRSCCLASAPLPVSQFKSSGPSLETIPLVVSVQMGTAPCVREVHSTIFVQAPSPPRTQSLLCTFLI